MAGLNLTGQKYGRLTVVEQVGADKHQNRVWDCLCDCGNTKTATTDLLRRGRTKSCGCMQSENAAHQGRLSKTHGHTVGKRATREMRAYWDMRARCYNPNNSRFADYGGRGIRVCDRWNDSFENFLSDMGRHPGHGFTLDRLRVDGDYSVGNCRWATYTQQARNRRSNRPVIRSDGKFYKTTLEAAEDAGVSANKLRQLIKTSKPLNRYKFKFAQPERKAQ